MDRHLARMRQSARLLGMPEPEARQLETMVISVVDRVRSEVPEPPGALYLRPMLIGTNSGVGGATAPPTEVMLMVLASPVWDYFDTGPKALRISARRLRLRRAALSFLLRNSQASAAAVR
jgi:branched-chain amino acid aminotransferase